MRARIARGDIAAERAEAIKVSITCGSQFYRSYADFFNRPCVILRLTERGLCKKLLRKLGSNDVY